jgi:putative hydrolase of the HAD superfamily
VTGDEWADDVTVVGFDGDDTLWHSEDAFAHAQERLAELLSAHASDEEVLSRLHEIERRNLELFGYGVKGFTLSMIETAIEVSGGTVPVADIESLLATGRQMLARPVDLLPGVAETVRLVASAYRIVLVTKGDLLNQESKIARSGLADLFESVAILSEKDVDSYLRIFRQLQLEPRQFLMVGNSEVSDVQPVLSLGAWAALVPYPLTSMHERGLSIDRATPRLRTLERIDELPGLLRLVAESGRQAGLRRTVAGDPASGQAATSAGVQKPARGRDR